MLRTCSGKAATLNPKPQSPEAQCASFTVLAVGRMLLRCRAGNFFDLGWDVSPYTNCPYQGFLIGNIPRSRVLGFRVEGLGFRV